jgi:nitrile hydratase subunit beta
MNGVHDLGGMHGFGPVIREENEPVFHADWEKRIFAINLALAAPLRNVDAFRHAIERMPPARYLSASYYEKWLDAIETLVLENGIATRDELLSGHSNAPAASGAAPPRKSAGASNLESGAVKLRFNKSFRPRFKAGDRVVTRNLNPGHHTRLPRYARAKHGVIRHDQGVFVFPDTHAHGLGAKPQHVYTVSFDSRELWGPDGNARAPVYLDCWEDYLERDRAAAKPRTRDRAAVKRAGASRAGKGRKR